MCLSIEVAELNSLSDEKGITAIPGAKTIKKNTNSTQKQISNSPC